MQSVGIIEEIWRYPVSSIGGEPLTSAELHTGGIPFDRQWALVDPETGKPASPERDLQWRPALFLKARVQEAMTEIGFPDGQWLRSGATNVGARLFEHFGFSVELRPYALEAQNVDNPITAENRYMPSPVHLLTTTSMDTLAATGLADVESRRFRPTILVRSDGEGFLEGDWIGESVRIGAVGLSVREEAKRCGMTMIAQPGLSENPDILRTIVRQNRRNLGIYCDVVRLGSIRIGDSVYIERSK